MLLHSSRIINLMQFKEFKKATENNPGLFNWYFLYQSHYVIVGSIMLTWVEIHQTLLSQFSLLVEFLTEKLPVKD